MKSPYRVETELGKFKDRGDLAVRTLLRDRAKIAALLNEQKYVFTANEAEGDMNYVFVVAVTRYYRLDWVVARIEELLDDYFKEQWGFLI